MDPGQRFETSYSRIRTRPIRPFRFFYLACSIACFRPEIRALDFINALFCISSVFRGETTENSGARRKNILFYL
jgi:hypothetical protein